MLMMSKPFIRYILLSALAVAVLSSMSSMSSAYTVTLIGACSSSPINATHSYLLFRLNNSGNGPAQEVVIAPVIAGAQTNQSTIFLPALNASNYSVSKIDLHNLSVSGTYVETFVVTYRQGTSSFVTMFPCLSYINHYVQSNLLVTNVSQKSDKVIGTVVNYGPYAINASISFLISPLYASQNATSYKNVSIAPGGSSEVSFAYKPIYGNNNSFSAGIAAQYYHNGSHYATLQILSLKSKSAAPFSFDTLIMLIVGVILIIAALIVISIVVGRRAKKSTKQQPSE